jgi:hypothetical protein
MEMYSKVPKKVVGKRTLITAQELALMMRGVEV